MGRIQSKTWKEQDLQGLIQNEIQEDSNLEYKASPALQKTDKKKAELAKDVSSFANSAGGIIIYGICEDEDNHLPRNLDEGLNPIEINKEWVEDVLQGNIHPRILGIDINQVNLETSHPGKVAYVLTIPQGETAHQASDKKYYKRFNFQAVAMEDHEIRDVMNRQKTPLVKPVFSFLALSTNLLHMEVKLNNTGAVLAQQIKLIFTWPEELPLLKVTGLTKRIIGDHKEYIFRSLTTPIFPEDDVSITELGQFSLYGDLNKWKGDTDICKFIASNKPEIRWKVFADNMIPQMGDIAIDTIPGFKF